MWRNDAGNQVSFPVREFEPKSYQEIATIVQDAERLGLTVRAVGASHSWSDVGVTSDYLVQSSELRTITQPDRRILKPDAAAPTLVQVGSGVTIRLLNRYLASVGLALPNMGGYDGQAFVGAASTSTHGSGLGFGPLSSFIRSIDLIASGGRLMRIEPKAGITEPSRYATIFKDGHLVQDDRWFNAAVVGMGCMGVVVSAIIEVVAGYWLHERRYRAGWRTVQGELKSGVLSKHRDYQVILNPYAVSGDHLCVVTVRDEIEPPSNPLPFAQRHRNLIPELLSSIPGFWFLAKTYFNLFPSAIPKALQRSLNYLAPDEYIDASYEVLHLGAPNKIRAYSSEHGLQLDGDRYIDVVNRMLALLDERARTRNLYLTSPMALRFVKAAPAYFSPQFDRDTCMVEVIAVKDSNGAFELMHAIEQEVQLSGGRPHWGQINYLTADVVKNLYPPSAYDAWTDVCHQLNASGVFNSSFSRRVGLSV